MDNTKLKPLLDCHSYILRLAESKCARREDAEDLVSDTYLAALSFIKGGGEIAHPKTWLANTFMHKYNDALRRRYSGGTIVNLDAVGELADGTEHFDDIEAEIEAAELRGHLLYLTRTTREVLTRHYFGGEDISTIARSLDIPEGTVKSRMAYGRERIRKGMENMESTANYIPGTLSLTFSGSAGPDGLPMSVVDGDLIAQNLLILAYEKPLMPDELAKRIGIPTVYIEPIIDRLIDGELMVRTDSGRVYTDFIIITPEDTASRFQAQLDFVRERYDIFREVMLNADAETEKYAAKNLDLSERQLMKLKRYVTVKMLQDYAICDKSVNTEHPRRRDGGRWTAAAWSFPAAYDKEINKKISDYTIHGGHRTTERECDYRGVKWLQLCEFDLPMWDSPHRFSNVGMQLYFGHFRAYLWCVYSGCEPDDIPSELIAHTDEYIELGMFTREDGHLKVDIPVLTRAQHAEIIEIAKRGTDTLLERIGSDIRELTVKNMIKTPPHITTIPDYWRQSPARGCIEMAVMRMAYERGDHLRGVDYCCPAAVLVYDK